MSVAKIIILNWNGADHLRRFLPSVVAAAPAGVEVIVATTALPEATTAHWSISRPTITCC